MNDNKNNSKNSNDENEFGFSISNILKMLQKHLPSAEEEIKDQYLTRLLEIFDDINSTHHKYTEEKIQNYIKELNDVFESGYKIKYYDSFRLLQGLFPESKKNYDDIDVFNEKLKKIIDSCDDRFKHSESIIKLVDYLMLECSRFEYNKPLRDSIENIDSLTSELKKQENQIDDLLEKSKNTNNQSITIFTIFSAIIMTFSGGISFTASALKSMSNVSAYRIVFVISLVGFALFNTIFMLLFVISRIIDKSIKIKCKYKTLKCYKDKKLLCENYLCAKHKKRKKNTFWCKLKEEYPYIFYIDIFFSIVMIIDFLLWVIFKPNNDVGIFVIKYSNKISVFLTTHPCIWFIVLGIVVLSVLIILICKIVKRKVEK